MRSLVRVEESFAQWKRSVRDADVRIPVRSIVVASWRRSAQAGVQSDPVLAARIPEKDLQNRLACNEEIMNLGIPYCDWLSANYAEIRHVAVLTDCEGIILYSAGNDLTLIDSYGLLPGYDWSEERLGTNAIGTALKLDSPLAIHGPEHFSRPLQTCSTAAAVLHDAQGKILGAIAIQCHFSDSAPGHLNTVSHLASDIQCELGYRAEIRLQQTLQDEMSAAKLDAEAANSDKSEFLAAVSHDLRTPIHAILGFCRVIEAKQERLDPDSLSGYCRRIRLNAEHQLNLINGLLELATTESAEIKPQQAEVRIDTLVKDTVECLCELRNPEVRSTVLIPEQCRPIWTDEMRLKQILTNLVSNAFKYTQHGEVLVRVLTDSDEVPVQIDVADTGEGIPEAAAESIFQPFRRMHRAGNPQEGNGLGLAISRSLARMLGYDIRLASKLGEGSVFSVLLRQPKEASGKIPA